MHRIMLVILMCRIHPMMGVKNESTRIVGGQPINRIEYPYSVRLHRYKEDDIGFCMGMLISSRFVVTAAHCISSSPTHCSVRNILGSNGNECEGSYVIKSMRVHPDFVSVEEGNDIALIELHTSPACFGEELGPTSVTLDGGNIYTDFPEHVTCTVIGHGSTQPSGEGYSPVLMGAVLNMYTRAQCEAFIGPIAQTSICIGHYMGAAIDSCYGDSGGGCFVNQDGKHILVGIVSYGPVGCAVPTYPGVYTHVGSFASFVKLHVPDARFSEITTPPVDNRCDCDCGIPSECNQCLLRDGMHVCYITDPINCADAQPSISKSGHGWIECGNPKSQDDSRPIIASSPPITDASSHTPPITSAASKKNGVLSVILSPLIGITVTIVLQRCLTLAPV